MTQNSHQKLLGLLNENIEPFTEEYSYRSILDAIGEAQFVMIGEATHGTQEFYQTRIKISQHLIKEKGFMAVAIEGDWPDAHTDIEQLTT